jgi:hypothetical protein
MLVIIKKWYSSSDMASLAIHVYINIFSISNIMSSFVITPGNIDDINFVIKDPLTGKWSIPILTFNPLFNPYYSEIDVLNEDRRYQDRVIDHFHTRLTEKWLFKKPIFKKLLKYFEVEKKDNHGTVKLVSDPENIKSGKSVSDEDKKFILKYIDKYFITRRFVEKVLREYVSVTHIKWYDLFNNSDTLIDLFAHKLKKLIISTIYDLKK